MSTRTIAAGVAAASLLALLGAAPAEARAALNALSMNGLSINGLSVNGPHVNGVGSTGVEHGAPGRPAAFNPNALRVVGVTVDATPLNRTNSASPKLLRIP